MKYNRFWVLIFCAFVASCQKDPDISVSRVNIEFDAFPENSEDVRISSNTKWTITITPTEAEDWITVEPMEGSGRKTVAISALDNLELTERTAKIFILSGEETDSIMIRQDPSFDVTEKISDPAFRQFVLNNFDHNGDGKISMREARSVSSINARNQQIGRHNGRLDGIEYFTELIRLNISDNFIENLDLSKNTKLRELNCAGNRIERLDLRNNIELRILNCGNDLLTSLNIDGLDKLEELSVWWSELTSINVSTNTALRILEIDGNPISSLNVSNNGNLRQLSVNSCRLTTLDLSNNPLLEGLYCADNYLTSLNLSANPRLRDLWCDRNRFTGGTINLSNNRELLAFSGIGNNFTSLDLSNNVNLTRLNVNMNSLTSIDLSNNTELQFLEITSNNFSVNSRVDIRNNQRLAIVDFGNNPNIDEILVWHGFLLQALYNQDRYRKDAHARWVTPPIVVTFEVIGGNGSITATVNGVGIAQNAEVQQDRTIVFTAAPNNGFRVRQWRVNGSAIGGNTTNTFPLSNHHEAEARVTVEFMLIN